MISNCMMPDGTLISAMSPTFFPNNPCAIGVLIAIFPSFRLASESETSVYHDSFILNILDLDFVQYLDFICLHTGLVD